MVEMAKLTDTGESNPTRPEFVASLYSQKVILPNWLNADWSSCVEKAGGSSWTTTVDDAPGEPAAPPKPPNPGKPRESTLALRLFELLRLAPVLPLPTMGRVLMLPF